jgi:hypothetical protein
VVLLLHRSTTRLGEIDDPTGLFFHRVRIGRVSLVFMGENDQENFSALCALDPNIDAIHQAGRVFFWNDLEGTPREKIDHLAERISHVLMPADTERVASQPKRSVIAERPFVEPWRFKNIRMLLASLAFGALFLAFLCTLPPIEKHTKVIAPGAERWTQSERASYLNELHKLELERQAVDTERQRIESVRRKMIAKINDIEELETTINHEKRNIVCGLLERREDLMRDYISLEHAQRHISDLGHEVRRMESQLSRLPHGSREEIELQRNINEKKYDIRVWEEGLAELKKVEDELARSDVFSWASPLEYCEKPLTTVY